jgi:hypothetical protein
MSRENALYSCHISFLGAFVELREATTNFTSTVMEKRASHGMKFHEM